MKGFDAIAHRRALHQIPEPGFEEHKTQEYLLNYLHSLPQDNLTIETWKTGIFVLIHGEDSTRTVAYRADMDGLPVQEETGLPFSSRHSGYMHACGHDFHMTIALGLAAHYAEHRPKTNVLIVFQPAEEGPGGAEGMIQTEFFAKHRPEAIFAFHVNPELPVDHIGIAPGVFFANASELFIELTGKGGHAARPHLGNDMVIAATSLIQQLQTIVSRNVDPTDTAVITIGKVDAGVRQNVIAEKAYLAGTIRALKRETMSMIKQRIREVLAGVSASFNCETSVDWGANYIEVKNDPDLTDDFTRFIVRETDCKVVEYPPLMVGEDFGFFLDEIPGFIAWLGVDSEAGLHLSRFLPDEKALPLGIDLARRYLDRLMK